jgi:ribosomal protein L21E
MKRKKYSTGGEMNTGTESTKSGGFEVGKAYKGVDGHTYRFMGDKGNGKGLFMLGREYVLKSYDDIIMKKVGLFEEGGRVYKLGDKWSSDFDYDGMLETASQADLSWGVAKLDKLSRSLEDVNYHTVNKPLYEAIQLLKAGHKEAAEKEMAKFHSLVKEELNEEFAKGGVVKFVKEGEQYKNSWGRKGFKEYHGNCIGAFDLKEWKHDYGFLYELNDFDKKYWSDVPLKQNEMLFRYESDATKIGGMLPVIKINLEKGLIYFIEDLYSDDDKNLKFETRGVKPLFISLHESVYTTMSKKPNYKMTDFFEKGGKISAMDMLDFRQIDLKDVYYELDSRIGNLRIIEENKDGISCDVKDWGIWEHDYQDYERDEEDFEDDDFMILSNSSSVQLNNIIKEVLKKYPKVDIEWDTSEKSYIDIYISRKVEMAKGGKVRKRFYDGGGQINWGKDLSDGYNVGTDVHITDKNSMFKGKAGFIIGEVGKDFLVTISIDGNDRNVVVSKKGVEKIDEPFAKGGELSKDEQIWQIKGNGGKYVSVGMDGKVKWFESPDKGYTYTKEDAESFAQELGLSDYEIVKYDKNWWKMGDGGKVDKFLHVFKLTYPSGDYRIESYEGEYMSPNAALMKMRISLNGLKSYKYTGTSGDSYKYKEWQKMKANKKSDRECWDAIFEKEMAEGGVMDKEHIKTYTLFDRHAMSADVREEILDIIGEVQGEVRMTLKNQLFGLFDGYLYNDILINANKQSSELYDRISKVVDKVSSYPKFSKGGTTFRDGGDIGESNTDMLHSQVQEIKHHAMELSKLVHKDMYVEAWVVVKAQRAATDLSDITHYLDGEENKFEHGGNIPEENVSMLHNQVKNIKHHAMELSELVHKGMEVEPWVIGKAQRVASDLSDITHYLDGESDKFEHGGYMADGGEVGSFEKKVKDAMKVTNKWHFINEQVNGNEVQLKMFVGAKEVDVQIFKINGKSANMPRNYSGKRDTLQMIMDAVNKISMAHGGYMDDGGMMAKGGNLDAKYTPDDVYQFAVESKYIIGFQGREDILYFKSKEEAKNYVKERPSNRTYLGIIMADGSMMAKGGKMKEWKGNLYVKQTSVDYFGDHEGTSKSPTKRWFRVNRNPMTKGRLEEMAKPYIEKFGKENVKIKNFEMMAQGGDIDDFKFTFETNEDLAKAESTGYVPDYDIVRIEVDLGDGNTVDFPVKTREQYANELETRGDKIMNAYQDKMYFDINEYATDEDNEEYEEEYAKGGNVRKRTGLNLIKVDDQMKKITRGRIVNVKLPNEVKAFKTKVVDVYDDFVTTARGIFSKKYIFEDGGSVPQKKYDDTVARTILAQLGGSGRLTAMTGAYQFTNVQGRGLAFKIKNARANYIKIMLNSMDLYDVEIGRIRGGQYKIVKEGLGLYADQLKRFIENGTGMRLSLAKGGDVKRSRYADGGQLDPVVFDVFIMMPEDEMMGMEEEPDVYEASAMQYKKGGVSLKHKK